MTWGTRQRRSNTYERVYDQRFSATMPHQVCVLREIMWVYFTRWLRKLRDVYCALGLCEAEYRSRLSVLDAVIKEW